MECTSRRISEQETVICNELCGSLGLEELDPLIAGIQRERENRGGGGALPTMGCSGPHEPKLYLAIAEKAVLLESVALRAASAGNVIGVPVALRTWPGVHRRNVNRAYLVNAEEIQRERAGPRFRISPPMTPAIAPLFGLYALYPPPPIG